MIRYSLHCRHGHEFEEWFSRSGDYDDLAAAGKLHCPDCGDSDVAKSIMAPAIGKPSRAETPACPVSGCAGGGCAFAQDA